MEKIVGIRFSKVGKKYYFITDIQLEMYDKVIVETVRGLEMGEVVTDLKDKSEFKMDLELKHIIRKATLEDIEIHKQNEIKANEAIKKCKLVVDRHNLDMNLIQCEYTHDASKVIFTYTSQDRVDFRDILKELASIFKCRIELRQVGPRDRAKVIGGIGVCGMPLCCATFLGEFNGVSINMAKNQMLSLNVDKISGICGRLMCCLKYEDSAYNQEKQRFPKVGSKVIYENEIYKIVSYNVINNQVKISNDTSSIFVDIDSIRIV